MSKVVEDRIVKMEFDNSKFERNVKTSLGTIDRLKKSLNFDEETKSIRQLQHEANKFTLDDIGASLDQLGKRFTGFGIAGARVIWDLTGHVEKLAKTIGRTLTAPFRQLQNGGWARAMKIKDAKFSIEGLGKDFNTFYDDINNAVAGTAYGFDSAARAAAQFAASGIKVSSAGGSMATALRSVSGVAAQTNSSYDDIASIFTTIAANGKVMTQQLRQLSFRGMNASAVLAKSMGTTEAAVSQMVTKGEISFDQFAKAMDDAFGEHATAANETFQGALDNMKAALSRMGANFADPLIDAERDVFNITRDILNSTNNAGTKVGDTMREFNKLQEKGVKLTASQAQMTELLNGHRKKETYWLTEVGKAAQKELDKLDALPKKTKAQQERMQYLQSVIKDQIVWNSGAILRLSETFSKALEKVRSKVLGFLQNTNVNTALNNIIDTVNIFAKKVQQIFRPIKEAFRSVFGSNEAKLLADLTEKFKQFAKSLDLAKRYGDDIKRGFTGVFAVLDTLKDVIGDLFHVLGDIAKPILEMLLPIFGSLGDILLEVDFRFNQVRAGISFVIDYFKKNQKILINTQKIFNGLSKVVRVLGVAFGVVASVLGTALAAAAYVAFTAFENLAGIFAIIWDKISPIASVVGGLLKSLGGLILKIVNTINPPLTVYAKGTDKVNQNTEKLGKKSIPILSTLIGVLVKTGSAIRDFVVNGITFLTNAIDNFSLEGFLTGIRDKFMSVVDDIRSGAATIPDIIGRGITNAIAGLAGALVVVKNAVIGFFSEFTKGSRVLAAGRGEVEKVEEKSKSIIDLIKDFGKSVKESSVFENAKKGLENVGDAIDYFAKKITPARVLAFLFAGAFVMITKTVLDLSNALAGFLKAASSTPKAMSGMFQSIGGLFKQLTRNIEPVKRASTTFREVAVSIAILAGSIYLLSKITQEDLSGAAVTLGVLAVGLVAFTAALNATTLAVGNGEAASKLMKAVLAFSASLLILVQVVKQFNNFHFDTDNILEEGGKVVMVLSLLVGVTAAVIALSKNAGEAKTSAIAILAMSTSLLFMVKAFEQFVGMDAGAMWSALLGLIPVLGAMWTIAKAMEKIKFTSALGLIAAAVALRLAVPIIQKIAAIDFTNIIDALSKYAAVIIAIGAIGIIVGVLTKGSFMKSFSDFGKGLLLISSSCLIMSLVIKQVGGLDGEALFKGLVTVGLFLGLIIAMERLSYFTAEANFKNFGVGMLALSVALGVMVGVVAMVGLLDPETLLKGVAFIGVLSIFIMGLELCSKNLSKLSGDHWKLLAAMAASVAVLGIALGILSTIPWEKLWPPMVAMGVCILAFGESLNLIGKGLSNITKHKAGGAIAMMLLNIGMLIVLAFALYQLSNQPWQGLIAGGSAMAVCLVAFGFAFKLISESLRMVEWKTIFEGLALMAGMIPIILTLGYSLSQLAQYPWENVAASGVAMSLAMLAFGKVIGTIADVLGPLGELPWGVYFQGILKLVGIIGLIIGLCVLINQIGYWTSGGKTSGFEYLGKMIGDFVGGIGKGLSDALPDIGKNLGDFAEKAKPFFDVMKDLAESGGIEAATAVFGFFDTLGKFKLNEAKANIKNLFWGTTSMSMEEIGNGLKDLGVALKDFAAEVEGLSSEDLKGSIEAAGEILGIFDKFPKTGGVVQAFFGEVDMEGLVTNLPKLGKALVKFSTAVSKDGAVDKAAVRRAALCMDMLNSVVANIPASGGVVQTWFGSHDMAALADSETGLPKLGAALTEFSTNVVGLKEDAVSKAATCMEMINAFANNLPKDGGWIQTIFGSHDMKVFGEKLGFLGAGLSSFSANTDTIKSPERIGIFAEALVSLSDAAAKIKSAGAKTLNKFTKQLKDTGKHLVAFRDKLNDVGWSQFSAQVSCFIYEIERLSDLDKRIGSQGADNIKSLTNDLSQLSFTGMNAVSYDTVDAFSTTMKGVIEDFKASGADAVAAYAEGMKGAARLVKDAASVLISGDLGLIPTLKSYQKNSKSTGQEFSHQFALGIKERSKLEEIRQAARDAGKKALDALDAAIKDPVGVSDESFKLGLAFTNGFRLGIKKLADQSDMASAKLGLSAVSALDKAIEDPEGMSDKTFDLGKAFGNGFKEGINTFLTGVNQAAAALGFSGLGGLEEIAGKVKGFITNFTGEDFANGLFDAIAGVKKKGKESVEGFFKSFIPDDKDVKKMFEDAGGDAGAGFENGLNKAAKSGGGGKSGSGETWLAKDLLEALMHIKGIFQKTEIEYDAFNAKLLKKGKITAEYLYKSIKDSVLRSAVAAMGDDALKGMGLTQAAVAKKFDELVASSKKYKDAVANLKPGEGLVMSEKDIKKYTNKAIKQVTKEAIKGFEEEYAHLQSMILDTFGDKKTMKAFLSDNITFVSTYLKYYDSNFKTLKSDVKQLTKLYGGNAEAAKNAISNLGDYLYKQSDEYKDNVKTLKTNQKQLDKIQEKAKKYIKIINDPKASAKRKQAAKQRLADLNKEAQTIYKANDKIAKSIAKGPTKAIKELKKEIKETVQDYIKISNLDFSKTMSGFSKFEAGTQLLKEASSTFDVFSESATAAAENVSEAFDIFSSSFETGINLLEKFTKTGTAEVEALMERADGQLEAYEEFQNGIANLESKGFDQSLIDDLEEQGPSALNYIRGFMNMSDDEVKAYNEKIAKKREYEGKKLERSMAKQKRQYEQWVADIETLAARGLSDGIIQKLKDSGVGQAEFVHAMTGMSSGSLSSISSYYASAITASYTEAYKESAKATASFNPLENLKKADEEYGKWQSKLETAKGRGISEGLLKALEEAGYQSQEILDWVISTTDEQLAEYDALFSKYNGTSVSGGIRTMIDNLNSQTAAMNNWNKWVDEIKASDPRLYEELRDMGFETGYEYAQAWMEGDEVSRAELSEALKKRDEADMKEQIRQMKEKFDNVRRWRAALRTLAEHDEFSNTEVGRMIWEELYEMGPDGTEAAEYFVACVTTPFDEMSEDQKTFWETEWKPMMEAGLKLDDNTANSIKNSYAMLLDDVTDMAVNSKENIEEPIKEATKESSKAGTKEGITQGYAEAVTETKKTAKSSGKKIGKATGAGVAAGMQDEETLKKISSAADNLGSAAITELKKYLKKSKGKKLANNLIDGINQAFTERRGELTADGALVISCFKKNINQQTGLSLGSSVVEGINLGISQAEPQLYARAYALAAQLRAIIAAALQVNSPSKVMIPIGEAIPEGLEVGMEKYAPILYKSAEAMAGRFSDTVSAAVTRMSDLGLDGNLNPVIKPTLDLSDVTRQARELSSILDTGSVSATLSSENQNEATSKSGGMTFIQNNYSPKALDRLELYRQTKNQFANAKGLVMA